MRNLYLVRRGDAVALIVSPDTGKIIATRDLAFEMIDT